MDCQYESFKIPRFFRPEKRQEEIVADLRYFSCDSLDNWDTENILKAEGFLIAKGASQKVPTGKAYSVVWLKGGWWVPAVNNLLLKYEVPPKVKKAAALLIGAVLRHEFSVKGWLPPNLVGTKAEDVAPPAINSDEKNLLKAEIERAQMILAQSIKEWSTNTLTTPHQNTERIDSWCRWTLRTNYGCTSNWILLLKRSDRRKTSRQERNLTAKQALTGKGANRVNDRYLASCERLPVIWSHVVDIISKTPLQEAPPDYENGTTMKPIFRWVGGKRRQVVLVQRLLSLLEEYPQKIIEPFCGAASMSLGLGFTEATINDRNPGLINFYRHVRSGKSINTDFVATYSHYVAYRQAYNKLQQSIILLIQSRTPVPPEVEKQWASLFRYLIEFAFNGIWRANAAGGINMPPRLPKTLSGVPAPINYPASYPHFQRIARKWQITNRDFSKVEQGDKNTLLYVDPPYDGQFNGYTGGFKADRQEELFKWMSTHPGPIICHNSFTPNIVILSRKYKFDLFCYEGRTTVAASLESRGGAQEVIMIKNFKFKDFG